MTWKGSLAVVLGLGLACAGSLRAGVYSSRESSQGLLSPDFRRFQMTLDTLQKLGRLLKARELGQLKEETPLTSYYLRIADLTARGVPAGLSTTGRLDLGAALLRLGKPEEAVQVLEVAKAQDPRDFLIFSNLSTAEHLAGREQRALDYMAQVFDLWPARWDGLGKDRQLQLTLLGWDAKQFEWYRHAETYYRKLLRLRLREAVAASGGRGGPEVGLDALFDDGGKPPRPVRFVGPSGKYEAGALAPEEKAKLPPEALEIVEQLLVWLPDDVRLYWLLGELYNARGDTATARGIFNYLVNGLQVRYPELREHRRILQAQSSPQEANRGSGAGTLPPPESTPPPPEEDWTPSPWETLVLGFLVGLVVAFLGYWQVKEIQRRRRRAAAPKS
jgi:tetratricopeptide (TPR) repeat protein